MLPQIERSRILYGQSSGHSGPIDYDPAVDLSSDKLAALPIWLVAFLFSTTCHEAAHAWAALRGGDRTAYEAGQVTLDPTYHVKREPFGMLLVPILSYLWMGFTLGWASAPYNPHWAARHPKRAAWMALAGPGANLLLAVLTGGLMLGLVHADVFALAYRPGFDTIVFTPGEGVGAVSLFLSIMFSLNLLLFAFNLIPVPPLDGAGGVNLVLNARQRRTWEEWQSLPALRFGGLLLAWYIFPRLFWPLWDGAAGILKAFA